MDKEWDAYLSKSTNVRLAGAVQGQDQGLEKESQSEYQAKAEAMRVRVPVKLSWCHFLPLFRYILIIRSISENDVEAIFRVNSLSSFTLGTAQLVGLMFTFSNFDGDFANVDMFVYVNMFSQLVNWSITILYFSTSVSKTMSNSILVESYKANVHELVQKDILYLKQDVKTDVKQRGEEPSKLADRRIRRVEWEVKMMKNVTLKLDTFLPQDTLQIRRVLLQQWADEFSRC